MSSAPVLAAIASASARVFAVTVLPLLLVAPVVAFLVWAYLWQALRLSCGMVPRLGELAAWSFLPLAFSGLFGVAVSVLLGIAELLGLAGPLLHDVASLLEDVAYVLASIASLWLVFTALTSLAPGRAVVGTASFASALLLFHLLGWALMAHLLSVA